MKQIKFKDVKDGQVFAFDTVGLMDKITQRVKKSWTKTFNNAWVDGCESSLHDVPPDTVVYVEEPEIPELDKGIYCMAKHDSSLWLFGLYDGIEDGRYRFQQAKNTGTFTINPQKWYVRKFMLRSL